MLKMRLSKNKAFTTAEAIVALAISISLIFLAVLKVDAFQSQIMFDNTVREVNLSLEHAARIAAIKNEAITVSYFSDSGYIYFRGSSYQGQIKINPEITIENLKRLNITKEGTISPRTLTFHNKQQQRKVRIQMLWGKISD